MRAALPQNPSVVSGALLLAAKKHILSRYRPGALHVLAQDMGEDHAGALLHPDPGVWYPQRTLIALLEAVYTRLAGSELGRFHALVYDATLSTMRYEFREAMDLGSVRAALASAPRLWQRLGRSVGIQYHDPGGWLSIRERSGECELLYRQMQLAMLRALLYAASGVEHSVTLVRHRAGSLEVRVGGLAGGQPHRPLSGTLTDRSRSAPHCRPRSRSSGSDL